MFRPSSITPMALQYLNPPEEQRMALAILLAISRSEVSRFTL